MDNSHLKDNRNLKPKILFVITQGEWGGAQRYVFDLATNLSQDFDVTIAVGELRGKDNLQNKIKQWNMEHGTWNIVITPLRHLVRSISSIHDVLAVFELAKLYKTLKPDIIHLNSSKAGILGSLTKLLIKLDSRFRGNDKIRVVYTVHGWVFNEPLGLIKKTLYCWLEKFTARWKDKIIVLSPQDFLSGKQIGISEKKLIEIPLGIEALEFLDREETRNKIVKLLNCKIVAGDKLIGTIANLYSTKGIDILIEAINMLKRDSSSACGLTRNNGVRFIVIGEGPERKNLEDLIKKYHLKDTVFLIGAIDNAARYLPAFDLFVLPSRKEGLPYTLLEAMTQGTPIIATNTGGVSSLIQNKKNGLLVEFGDTRQLSDAIFWAINNREEIKKRAERASEDVKLLTIEKMIDLTKTTYFSHPLEESWT